MSSALHPDGKTNPCRTSSNESGNPSLHDLIEAGLAVTPVNKVAEGRPHIVDMIKNGEMNLIINTVEDKRSAIQDSYSIRHAVLQARVTYYTTLAGARAACIGMANIRELQAYRLQELHAPAVVPAGVA